MKNLDNSLVIIGTEEGVAGQLHDWLKDYNIISYIHYAYKVDFKEISRDKQIRKNKNFEYPKKKKFKNTPMVITKDYISILKSLSVNNIIVTISDNKLRNKIMKNLIKRKFNLISYIHPSAIILKGAIIEKNVIIFAGVIIGYKVHIKQGTFINTGCSIDHHTIIEKCVTINPRSVLAGNVFIDKFVCIHPNVSISKRLNIGKNSIIGIGSVLLKDVQKNCICYGNPAKVIRRNYD